jgi:hypothetical protein
MKIIWKGLDYDALKYIPHKYITNSTLTTVL